MAEPYEDAGGRTAEDADEIEEVAATPGCSPNGQQKRLEFRDIEATDCPGR